MRCEFHIARNGRPTCRDRVVGVFRSEDIDGLGIPVRVRPLCRDHFNWMRMVRYRLTSVDASGQLRLFGLQGVA